eukprot:TRINITY_DN20022_c0_g1_i1.p1 TRINITY_DN20022_c0_g1~~TRINITY_DN20022_c0_g1_i1.p1  ORF type:complete len:347 (-),score=59.02 TRINITY_DN20022_c0_g1_i1:157-1092(-)
MRLLLALAVIAGFARIAAEELHVAPDGKPYSEQQFKDFFGTSWREYWDRAPSLEALQSRAAAAAGAPQVPPGDNSTERSVDDAGAGDDVPAGGLSFLQAHFPWLQGYYLWAALVVTVLCCVLCLREGYRLVVAKSGLDDAKPQRRQRGLKLPESSTSLARPEPASAGNLSFIDAGSANGCSAMLPAVPHAATLQHGGPQVYIPAAMPTGYQAPSPGMPGSYSLPPGNYHASAGAAYSPVPSFRSAAPAFPMPMSPGAASATAVAPSMRDPRLSSGSHTLPPAAGPARASSHVLQPSALQSTYALRGLNQSF